MKFKIFYFSTVEYNSTTNIRVSSSKIFGSGFHEINAVRNVYGISFKMLFFINLLIDSITKVSSLSLLILRSNGVWIFGWLLW